MSLHGISHFLPRLLAIALILGTTASCSVRKLAIRKLGDALSSSGTTFAADDDPELVKAAVPFSLKLIESLLAESPKHSGLLLAAASGFTQYSYAFVQEESDERQDADLAASETLRARARRLYARARDYGLRGLEVNHPGFRDALRADAKTAVRQLALRDVPVAFWTAAAWGAGISVSKDDPQQVADQLLVEALLDRVLALDESFQQGAIHTVLISYEMARQGQTEEASARSRRHFERALALSKGKLASPLVNFAEAVSVQQQDRAAFESLLQQALAINADEVPEHRLENLVAQRRARWLLGRMDELILDKK